MNVSQPVFWVRVFFSIKSEQDLLGKWIDRPLPENREDSCHLANCTDFVSDYFFSCCSCTYFQWNKRESQAHVYLWGNNVIQMYCIEHNFVSSIMLERSPTPKSFKVYTDYKVSLAHQEAGKTILPSCSQNKKKNLNIFKMIYQS